MRRAGAFVVAAVMLLGLLSGCASAKSIDVQALSDQIKQGVTFGEELTPVDAAMAERIYKISADNVKSLAGYAGSGATVDQVLVVEAKDDKAAQTLKSELDKYLETQITNYESYKPEEVPKLTSPVLQVSGPYVILVISADASAADTIVKDALK